MPRHRSRTTSTFRLGERIEDVVVPGRGVVREDQSEHVNVEASKVVDPTADAFAAQAAGASVAAVGMVSGDRAAFESERRRDLVVQPAAVAVAAIASIAADGPVAADEGIEDGFCAGEVKAAAQTVAAGAALAITPQGRVVRQAAAQDYERRRSAGAGWGDGNRAVEEAAAEAVAAVG